MSDGKEDAGSQPPSPQQPTPLSVPNPGLLGLPPPELLYSPERFAGVALDADVLTMITSFVPSRVELFPALAPFFPDYLPAAGGIDACVRPPRPDGRECELGTRRLDEPAPLQSDPTVLDLQLRALSKTSGLEPVAVRALEHAEKNPKEILKWVASIAELRRSAPPPSVHYSRPMPEIEALMQEWPASFEQLLRQVRGGGRPRPTLQRPRADAPRSHASPPPPPPYILAQYQVPLPTADINMSTEEYARVVCALLDIPVHPGGGEAAPGSLIQSLHLLFSLYTEFKSNAHFAGATFS